MGGVCTGPPGHDWGPAWSLYLSLWTCLASTFSFQTLTSHIPHLSALESPTPCKFPNEWADWSPDYSSQTWQQFASEMPPQLSSWVLNEGLVFSLSYWEWPLPDTHFSLLFFLVCLLVWVLSEANSLFGRWTWNMGGAREESCGKRESSTGRAKSRLWSRAAGTQPRLIHLCILPLNRYDWDLCQICVPSFLIFLKSCMDRPL